MNTMKLVIFAFIVFFIAPLHSEEGKNDKDKSECECEGITYRKLPKAVQKSIKKLKFDKITEIETEKEDGQTVYEVEFIYKGQEKEALFSVDGKLIKIEIEDEQDDD